MELPKDIVIEILSRLQWKILSRFKCVCRSWNALIRNRNRLIVGYCDDEDTYHVSFYPDETLQDLQSVDCVSRLAPAPISGDHPRLRWYAPRGMLHQDMNNRFVDDHRHYSLVPQNGIWYSIVTYTDSCYFLSLWNPFTKQMKHLSEYKPILPTRMWSRYDTRIIEFGFLPLTKDYKLVMIDYRISKHEEHAGISIGSYHVVVYTLGTDSWSDFEFENYGYLIPSKHTECTSVDGVCYWLFFRDFYLWNGGEDVFSSEWMVLSFDLRGEVFHVMEIGIPKEFDRDQDGYPQLGLYDESLSVLVQYGKKYLDILVMKEDGSSSSWIKQLTISLEIEIERPVGFWKQGSIFIQSKGHLLLYDITTKQLRDIGIKDNVDRRYGFVVGTYQPNFISLF